MRTGWKAAAAKKIMARGNKEAFIPSAFDILTLHWSAVR
jgi:hypothetical protein